MDDVATMNTMNISETKLGRVKKVAKDLISVMLDGFVERAVAGIMQAQLPLNANPNATWKTTLGVDWMAKGYVKAYAYWQFAKGDPNESSAFTSMDAWKNLLANRARAAGMPVQEFLSELESLACRKEVITLTKEQAFLQESR